MSVGHVARIFEEAGLATVIIAASPFRGRLAAMSIPRLLVTPHPMGRPLGPPGDAGHHREVLSAALDLLASATGPTIEAFSGRYRPAAR